MPWQCCTVIALIHDDVTNISRNVKPRLGGDRFAWFVDVLGKILRCSCLFFHFLFEMPRWCIAYGCTNSSDTEIKKSWYRLPLENKELLSKWLAKIRRTNTPVMYQSNRSLNIPPGQSPGHLNFWKIFCSNSPLPRPKSCSNASHRSIPGDRMSPCAI